MSFEEYMGYVWNFIDIVTTITGYIIDFITLVVIVLYERRIALYRKSAIIGRILVTGMSETVKKVKANKKYDILLVEDKLILHSWFRKVIVIPMKDIAETTLSDDTANAALRIQFKADDTTKFIIIRFDETNKRQRDVILKEIIK